MSENKLDIIRNIVELKKDMKESLSKSIIGQDAAVDSFVEGVTNSLLGNQKSDKHKPKGIFLFAGPPGVGKTLLAENGAAELQIESKRFDMSGYVDREDSMLRLQGLDPAWKGSHEGDLTGFVNACNQSGKACVLIFDEIEKANPSVIHLFLQILDSGRLTDACTKKVVYFDDAFIVFTTNAGRSLYESGTSGHIEDKQVILDAIRNDKNRDGRPLFPEAILSRFGTGYVSLFQDLDTRDLAEVGFMSMKRTAGFLQKQYNREIIFDKKLAYLLLMKLGGDCDARNILSESRRFIQTCYLDVWDEINVKSLPKNDTRPIIFKADLDDLPADENKKKPVVVWYFSENAAEKEPESKDKPTLRRKRSIERLFKKGNIYEICLKSCEYGIPGSKSVDQYEERSPFVIFMEMPDDMDDLKQFETYLTDISKRHPYTAIFILYTESQYESISRKLGKKIRFRDYVRDLGARGICAALKKNGAGIDENAINDILEEEQFSSKCWGMARASKRLDFSMVCDTFDDRIEIAWRNIKVVQMISGSDRSSLISEDRRPTDSFDDIYGSENVKKDLKDIIAYLKDPQSYPDNERPKGVLLYGPPGTGKTMHARAIANEAGVPFFAANGSEFRQRYVGEGAKAIRELFASARKYAPSIVFIDEVDVIAQTRSDGHFGGHEALNQLLSEVDGFGVDPRRPVFLIAATNAEIERSQPWQANVLDRAFVDRFERKIKIDLPKKKHRREYLKEQLKQLKDEIGEVKTDEIADANDDWIDLLTLKTSRMSFREINSVLELTKRKIRSSRNKNAGSTDLFKVLDDAIEEIRYGEIRDWGEDARQKEEIRERIAWHEAGHVFVGWKTGHCPEYVTINGRGHFGGYVMPEDREDQFGRTRREILDDVRCQLAGRAAELVKFGEEEGLATGPSSDFRNAGYQLWDYFCTYGMDPHRGIVFNPADQNANYIFSMDDIREEIERLLNKLMTEVEYMISNNKEIMEAFVKELLKEQCMYKEQINTFFRNRTNI